MFVAKSGADSTRKASCKVQRQGEFYQLHAQDPISRGGQEEIGY